MPGIRENGGQYTHAALWVVRALAELGRRERARALLEMLSPVSHARTAERVARLSGGAVRGGGRRLRRAAARRARRLDLVHGLGGLDVRVALESVLGLRMEGGERARAAALRPRRLAGVPRHLRLPDGGTRYAIRVRSTVGSTAQVVGVRVDGKALAPVDGAAVWPIARDGGRHEVEVELGQ